MTGLRPPAHWGYLPSPSTNALALDGRNARVASIWSALAANLDLFTWWGLFGRCWMASFREKLSKAGTERPNHESSAVRCAARRQDLSVLDVMKIQEVREAVR